MMRLVRSTLAVSLGAALLAAGSGNSPASAQGGAAHWVGTWAASPQGGGPGQDRPSFTDRTLRQIVHTSIGGDVVRVRLTNAAGTVPVVIGEAHVAVRDSGAAIRAGSDRRLTFGGAGQVTIAPGAVVSSDPAVLRVPEAADLAITLYVPGPTGPPTYHALSMQTNYTSPPGNHAGAPSMPPGETFCWTIAPRPCITPWYFLAGVDVSRRGSGAIVALGDSLTDGDASGDASAVDRNVRWPDLLARRLNAPARGSREAGVLNAGIAGNRVLGDGAGDSAPRRLDRDVLAQPGVRWVVFYEGINDLYNGGTAAGLIAAYQQIVQRVHARGLRIYGVTLTPAGFTDNREDERLAVNAWIRDSGQFDAVIDFDAVVRDPARPAFPRAAYDSGDHLHFTVAGYRAVADSIDLSLFRTCDLVAGA